MFLAYRKSRRTMSSNLMRLRPFTCHKSRNARLGFEHPAPMPDVVGLYFIGDGRTRSNQGHLTFENIDKLRQFVQAGPVARKPPTRVILGSLVSL